jgi:small-conductance mechanosensitive channel
MRETTQHSVANLSRAVKRIVGIVALTLIGVLFLPAQNSTPPQPSKADHPPVSQSAIALPPIQLDESAVLSHLNQLINWYRHSITGIQPVGLPSDAIYQDNAKNLSSQVLRLAFQSAKAEAAVLTAQQKKSETSQPSAGSTQQQNLLQLQAKTSSQIEQLQSQIESLNQQIGKTRAARRSELISQRAALQSQLELQKALLDAIQKMAAFVETNGEISGGLEGGINQLARSIPDVLGTSPGPQQTVAAATPAKPSLANSGGLISEAMTLYGYVSAMHQIDGVIQETNHTSDVADHLRMPLRDALRATVQQSQKLAGEPPATDPQQLLAEQQEFQELTERFKQLSGALLPLSQEIIVLNDSKTNFNEWRSSISRESRHVLRSVLGRVVGIVVALAVILVLSQIWRRITFRYVSDPRRRRQFLVMRRVVIGFLIGVVLVLGFVSEFSSLATFAGFITAGIAVGLQAVLLSVAAYFFIIGRYGIRVGDRISVAGVTGDVVDIGLVRLYLLELAGTGLDFYPTGRIVVFSNAVLFQTSTPLFKQIPGTEYTWHEVVVMIAPDGNHKVAQEKLVGAVTSVYSRYKDAIERQHAAIERHVDIQVERPSPEARLQFADAGLELLVRYPVEIRNAPDTDEEMTRKVLELIETDAALKAAVSGTPKIRSAVKG